MLEPADVWCAEVFDWKRLIAHQGYKVLGMEQIVRDSGFEYKTTACPIRLDGERLQAGLGLPEAWRAHRGDRRGIFTVTIPIIDTHQHLVYPDQWTYSWTKRIPELEGKAFRMEDYRREIEGTGIDRSVFMETTPDAWREEAALVYNLAGGSVIAGVIANCHPEEDDFEEYLDSIQNDKLVGLRRICHVEHDDFSRQPKFVEKHRPSRSQGTHVRPLLSRQAAADRPGAGAEMSRMCNSSSTTVVYPISRAAVSIRGGMTCAKSPCCPTSRARFLVY